jgi:hypothetical protein
MGLDAVEERGRGYVHEVVLLGAVGPNETVGNVFSSDVFETASLFNISGIRRLSWK